MSIRKVNGVAKKHIEAQTGCPRVLQHSQSLRSVADEASQSANEVSQAKQVYLKDWNSVSVLILDLESVVVNFLEPRVSIFISGTV